MEAIKKRRDLYNLLIVLTFHRFVKHFEGEKSVVFFYMLKLSLPVNISYFPSKNKKSVKAFKCITNKKKCPRFADYTQSFIRYR